MKYQQNLVEEKVDKMFKGMSTFSTTLQGAEVMFQNLQEEIDVLKSNSSEVWERLKMDEQRLSKLESSVTRLDMKLDDKVEMIQEWFVDMWTLAMPDIPVEIINSIQEVITDSSPGLAVNRMRVELDAIRGSMGSSRHVAESLRGLVVDLSEQVMNNSVSSAVLELRIMETGSRQMESYSRERDVVRKSIELAKKQLEQIISVSLMMDTLDISLIKKYKTVDVPAVHSTMGNIQKSLQKYVLCNLSWS